jgi:hypothetical protein
VPLIATAEAVGLQRVRAASSPVDSLVTTETTSSPGQSAGP